MWLVAPESIIQLPLVVPPVKALPVVSSSGGLCSTVYAVLSLGQNHLMCPTSTQCQHTGGFQGLFILLSFPSNA